MLHLDTLQEKHFAELYKVYLEAELKRKSEALISDNKVYMFKEKVISSYKPQWLRTVMWYIRNPLHNFFWHVIGFKDKPLDYTQIWNTKQKWNLVLPFFSYRGKRWEFYIGWRPDSKAFGIALRKRKNANNTY